MGLFRLVALVSLVMVPTESNDHEVKGWRRSSKSIRQLIGKANKPTTKSRGEDNGLFLRRMVLRCDTILDLRNCWEEVSHMGENIQLIHYLTSIHGLAVETDDSTIEDLFKLGITFSEDVERETLAVQESLQYHRSLSQGQQVSYALDLIRVTEVWSRYNVRGEGVTVCVMDTGVYANHPDFASSHLNGWNSTTDFVVPWNQDLAGHGTHITGILAASDNDLGYVGVAPDVQVYFIRVFTQDGRFYSSDVVAAAEACRDNGADFISMSLGGYGFNQGEHEIFRDLHQKHGIISLASAGNTGGPGLIYPAGYEYVVSTTACNERKRIPTFATYNSFVDIAAPGKWSIDLMNRETMAFLNQVPLGVNIPSTYIGPDTDNNGAGAYASLSGTSMAVPHVVGTLALMKSYAPKASADELLYALLQSTQTLRTNVDLGLVNALAAVQMLEEGVDPKRLVAPPCVNVSLSLTTDQSGQETVYRLQRISDKKFLWRGTGLESSMEYVEKSCVSPDDCYEFIIHDSSGNGILDPGHVELIYDDQIKLDNGAFGEGGKLLMGDKC